MSVLIKDIDILFSEKDSKYLYLDNHLIKEIKFFRKINVKNYILRLINKYIKYYMNFVIDYPESRYKLDICIEIKERIKKMLLDYIYIQRIKVIFKDKNRKCGIFDILIDRNHKISSWGALFGKGSLILLEDHHFCSSFYIRLPSVNFIIDRLQRLYDLAELNRNPCIINCNSKTLNNAAYNLDKNFIESLATDLGVNLQK